VERGRGEQAAPPTDWRDDAHRRAREVRREVSHLEKRVVHAPQGEDGRGLRVPGIAGAETLGPAQPLEGFLDLQRLA